jgi:hypothetical protein
MELLMMKVAGQFCAQQARGKTWTHTHPRSCNGQEVKMW